MESNEKESENVESGDSQIRTRDFDEVCDDSGSETDLSELVIQEAILAREIEEEIEKTDTVSIKFLMSFLVL